MSQDISREREGGKLGLFRKTTIKSFTVGHGNVDCTKARPGKSSLVDASLMMTREGKFTMTSRVVVVRHLGGLLCDVGPMVSLFNLSSLHPWGG